MNLPEAVKWIKTAGVAAVGGGIAGAFAAAMDPAKYSIAHDLGSGKLWKYFFMGAALTFGGALLKSPLGQKAMGAYKDSQQQLRQSQADIEAAKADLKSAGVNVEQAQAAMKPKDEAAKDL